MFIISTNIFAVSKVDEQTYVVSISNNIFLTQLIRKIHISAAGLLGGIVIKLFSIYQISG